LEQASLRRCYSRDGTVKIPPLSGFLLICRAGLVLLALAMIEQSGYSALYLSPIARR